MWSWSRGVAEVSISPVNGSHLARNNRMFSYAPFTQAKLNPTSFVLLSVSSVVMEYFCLLFYRNFSLSISSFHLSYELF